MFSYSGFAQSCDFPYSSEWNSFVKKKCINELGGYFNYLFRKDEQKFELCKKKHYSSKKAWTEFLKREGVVTEEYHWATVDIHGELNFKGNNCYNYATRLNTRTFAQPGRSSEDEERNLDLKKQCEEDYQNESYEKKACQPYVCGAIADGLKKVSSARECKSYEITVALAVTKNWRDRDFHWYRLDSSGYWTHKPGKGKPIKTDRSGKLITNPLTADRGPYEYFCGYLCVDHNKVKIE